MKPMFHKTLALALAAALLAGGFFPARASDALGHDLAAQNTALHEGVTLAGGTFWSDSHTDLRQENYVVYAPNTRVTPVVTYGETSRALTTVSAAARTLEAQGLRVVAGVNGDYYDTKNGLPIGSTMAGGVLRNMSGDPYCAVGFRADGTAVIGDPVLSMRVAVNGGSGFGVHAFNYLRLSDYGVFLYDCNFNSRHTTGTSESGVDVICSVAGGALTIGGALALTVDEVLPEATDTPVPEGKYVLTANLKATGYTDALLALRPGDELTVTVASGAWNASAWTDVENLLGAPVLLVQNGAVVSGLGAGSAPRTAVGQRADGSLVFYTIDGRRAGYSIGATLTAVAMRLVELGCVTAVALDGGGSTTMVATMPDATGARVVNTPSDGGERPVSNHVFLVAPNAPSGALDHVYLAPSATRALPGATVTLTAAAVDTNYVPMSAAVALKADKGSVSGNVLTLPAETGKVTVTASYGGKSATAEIAVAEPESIVVRRNGSAVASLTVAPGGSAELTAEGVTNHLALAGGNGCFDWAFEGSGVTFDAATHTLLAGSGAGAGTLTVSLGGKRAAIPVTVAVVPLKLLNDFEAAFADYADGLLTLSRATDDAHVRNGRASAKLGYALDGETPATLPLDYAVPAEYDGVTFWLCGDGSGAALTVETDAGPAAPLAIDFTGWRRLTQTLPDGANTVTGLTLSAASAATGALWLDQLALTYDGKTDETAPELSLTYDAETNAVAGVAFDAVDGAGLTTFRLACDGKALEYSRDARTGSFAAALPEADGFAHRVTLTAGDAAGNLARMSLDLPAAEDAEAAFPDTVGHWANDYVAYLKRAGLSNGGDGGLYAPDADITRQEFALMLYRYLALGEDYGGVELPFADAAQIGEWALDAARAMYAIGVIGGSPDGAGALLFRPTATISRQEAATIVGRLLDRGYRAPELAFADSADVPDWAAEHVRALSALGVLGGGDDGAFHPAAPLTRAQIAAMLFRLN